MFHEAAHVHVGPDRLTGALDPVVVVGVDGLTKQCGRAGDCLGLVVITRPVALARLLLEIPDQAVGRAK